MGGYGVLDGHYILHETVGSGGFAKVKSATHVITGERVAIKIMDKKSLGEDLPRIETEVKALKGLWHQNICRLYQVLETDEKIFLVLEHCAGGELFDYIVKKDRLPEPEARHFFRQIISAVAFVHSKGYAHRDLKPENLLLTEDLQLKLIDFGLCAKPDTGLTHVLETCCGSPAYAAPELIAGNAYFGNEADIWSMGVLLYALLCGFLPFEDDNLHTMYNKIKAGHYDEPTWLSDGSKSILKAMLQTNPRRRATIEQLLVHPWVVRDYSLPLKCRSIYEPAVTDYDCALELSIYYDCTVDEMLVRLKELKYDDLSSIYFLLLYKKRHNKPVILPPPPQRKAISELKPNVNFLIRSPTIHGSLEFNLNKIGLGDENLKPGIEDASSNFSLGTARHKASNSSKFSYSMAIGGPIDLGATPITTKRTVARSKITRDAKNDSAEEKENSSSRQRKGSSKSDEELKVTGTEKQNGHSQPHAQFVYSTPAGQKVSKVPLGSVQIAIQEATPFSTHLRRQCLDELESVADDKDKLNLPLSEKSHQNFRTPRSKSKTAALPRRVFNSMERQVDRVINALTPKRYRPATPVKMRHTKTLVNVSTTSSKSPDLVLSELLRVFEEKGITCKQRDWTIRGKAKDKNGRTTLTLELEVVYVERLNMVGVRRKRLNGDSFMYKRVCEDVLNLASL